MVRGHEELIMYLTREEALVRAGCATRYEDETAAFFDLLRQQSGLLRATLLNSFGTPARYTRLVQWRTRDEARAFDRSPALSAFLDRRPVDATHAPSRPLE